MDAIDDEAGFALPEFPHLMWDSVQVHFAIIHM